MGYCISILEGKLTKDVELTRTPGGKDVCNFVLAVNTKTDKSKDKAYFFNMQAWDGTAKIIEKWLKKGSEALFECTPKPESYQKKDGSWVNKVTFVVRHLSFVGKREIKGGSTGFAQEDQGYEDLPDMSNAYCPDFPNGNPEDDDVPF